jgi:hypothetical protein
MEHLQEPGVFNKSPGATAFEQSAIAERITSLNTTQVQSCIGRFLDIVNVLLLFLFSFVAMEVDGDDHEILGNDPSNEPPTGIVEEIRPGSVDLDIFCCESVRSLLSPSHLKRSNVKLQVKKWKLSSLEIIEMERKSLMESDYFVTVRDSFSESESSHEIRKSRVFKVNVIYLSIHLGFDLFS